MFKKNKLWLMAFIVIVSLWAEQPAKVENVIIVVIDGVRYQEGMVNLRALKNLSPQGVWIDTYYVGNPNKVTETNPDHAIMLTGTWQELYNDMTGYKRVNPGEDLKLAQPEGKYVPDRPTLFEYYRKENNVPSTSVALVVGKEKLKAMAFSTHPEYGEAYGAYTWNVKDYYASFTDEMYARNFLLDNVVALRVNEVIDQYHPKLMLVNLALVDYVGHKEIGTSPEGPKRYADSIQNADRLVSELWEKIQNDKIYKDKTVLIVLTDHGRHDDTCADGLKSHDGLQCTKSKDDLGIGTCQGVQHIFFFAIGPDIKKGFVSHTPRTLRDLAPTIAQLMHFHVPYATGSIMDEILVPGLTKNFTVDKGHISEAVTTPEVVARVSKFSAVGIATDADWKEISPLTKTAAGWESVIDVSKCTSFKFICTDTSGVTTWGGDGNSLGKADGVMDLPRNGEKPWKIFIHKASNAQQVKILLDEVTGKYTVEKI